MIFLNAIKIADKIKNPLINSIANSSLGDLYKEIGKYNLSTQYFIEALDYSLQTNNKYMQGIAYKNVGLMQKKTSQKDCMSNNCKVMCDPLFASKHLALQAGLPAIPLLPA